MKSNELRQKYNVPVYRKWTDVPIHLATRTEATKLGVVIAEDAKPDAIKNAASINDKDRIYFLYNLYKEINSKL